MRPIGSHAQNTTLSSAQTIVVPASATRLLLQAHDKNVRLRFDGTAPTASVGFQVTAGGEPLLIPVQSNSEIKVIEEAASAKIDYQFYAI